MSDQKLCAWTDCKNNRVDMCSYRNCNKCGKSIGKIFNQWCSEHKYGIDPSTNCKYLPPVYWSCLKCYPEDFDLWIPNEKEWGSTEDWKKFVAKSKAKITT